MPMYSACGNAALPALGFPIRASADHRLFSASPRLIAAVHALLRLLVPRHPPCALPILTVIRHFKDPRVIEAPGDTRCWQRSSRSLPVGMVVQFSRSASRRVPGLGTRSLKTQQHAPTGTDSKAVAESRAGRLREGAVRAPGPVDVSRTGRARATRYAPPARAGAPILELP